MSIQSSMGNSSMRLIKCLAEQIVAQNTSDLDPRLVSYRTDSEFVEAIRTMRQSESPSAQTLATDFHVSIEYVNSLLDNKNLEVVYPDSVSLFSDERVVICEQKLSGDNDSKAVTKNLEVLVRLKPHFQSENRVVETAIALTFTDVSKKRARKWLNHSLSPDHVVCNEAALRLLLGNGFSREHYSRLVDALAESAAAQIISISTLS